MANRRCDERRNMMVEVDGPFRQMYAKGHVLSVIWPAEMQAAPHAIEFAARRSTPCREGR